MNPASSPQPVSSKGGNPWDLCRFPNYAQAPGPDVLDGAATAPAFFYRNYVKRNRPCVVRGAVRHWPAFSKWGTSDYLRSAVDNIPLPARARPMFEYGITEATDPATAEMFRRSVPEEIGFHDFLTRTAREDKHLVLHSIPMLPDSPFHALYKDIGGFSFLPRPPRPRMYVPQRAFFYRNSYTDWHSHPADETLMTQVVGDKEVLLLPPTDQVFNAFQPVIQKFSHLYDIDVAAFPEVAALRPFRVEVRAGDALYIPVYWWHAVASADERFGVTVASTFASPISTAGDLRVPQARELISHMLRSRLFPLAVAGVAYAYASRLAGVFNRRT